MANLPTIVLNGLQGNEAPSLSAMQAALAPHASLIVTLYWIAWGSLLCYFILKLLFQKKTSRN